MPRVFLLTGRTRLAKECFNASLDTESLSFKGVLSSFSTGSPQTLRAKTRIGQDRHPSHHPI